MLLLNGILQLHYLKKYDASFTEHFYGLERVFHKNSAPFLSWMGLVLVSYCRRKAEKTFSTSRENILNGVETSKASKAFVQVYPYIHLLCQCVDIGRCSYLHFQIKLDMLRFSVELYSAQKQISRDFELYSLISPAQCFP